MLTVASVVSVVSVVSADSEASIVFGVDPLLSVGKRAVDRAAADGARTSTSPASASSLVTAVHRACELPIVELPASS